MPAVGRSGTRFVWACRTESEIVQIEFRQPDVIHVLNFGPDLDVDLFSGEKRFTVKLGPRGGLVRCAEDLVDILSELALLVFGESFIGASDSEVMGFLQHVRDREQVNLGGIDEADTVVDVVLGHSHAAEVEAHPVGADEVGNRAITPATCDLSINADLLSVELVQPIEQPHLIGIVTYLTYHGRSFLRKNEGVRSLSEKGSLFRSTIFDSLTSLRALGPLSPSHLGWSSETKRGALRTNLSPGQVRADAPTPVQFSTISGCFRRLKLKVKLKVKV